MSKPRCKWIYIHRPWTAAEITNLRGNRGTMTIRQLAASLYKRTPAAVAQRCKAIGLRKCDLRPAPAPVQPYVRWTLAEEAVLASLSSTMSPPLLAELFLPGRTGHAASARARHLGLKPWRRRWERVDETANESIVA